MCASKSGYGAAASRGSPTSSSMVASARSEPRAVIAGLLTTRPITRRAPADDAGRRGAHEDRRRPLEREQERLHRVAEGVVPPAPVLADNPVAGDDHRNGVPGEGVTDGARGARVADALRERRVRDDLAERDARGVRQHRGLELGQPIEVDGNREERPSAREVLAELLTRPLGVAAGAVRRSADAPPRLEARDAAVARLDAESIGERFEPSRTSAEPSAQAGERVARRNRRREELPEHQVEIHRQFSSARRRIALPRASWLLTVLTEIPRTRASSRYERPST